MYITEVDKKDLAKLLSCKAVISISDLRLYAFIVVDCNPILAIFFLRI